MKISEFCIDMAIQMEAARGMPQYTYPALDSFVRTIPGLCRVFSLAVDYKIIDAIQKRTLAEELYRHRPANAFGMYFWPPHQYAPRAKMLRKLAKIFAERGE